MRIAADLLAHRREFARAVANKHYEFTDAGILFPKQQTMVAGVMEHTLNHRDPCIDPNIIPTAGLNHLLGVLVGGVAQVNPWYVALFSANVTPAATLTAANFTGNQTEFVGYSEANRVTYVDGVVAAGAVDNDASRAEFTMSAGATIYGGALLSAQAKSAVIGEILCCAKFAAGRAVLSGDTLQVKYTLSATSL